MKRFFILFIITIILPAYSFAEDNNKPLWEVGLVSIGGYVPDYPSSDEKSLNGIVLPYLIYRGKIFRAGDKGIARGRIFRSDRMEFDVSLDGSFESDSDKNSARNGMPDLDYLFEIGPRLQMTLTNDFRGGKVDFEIPLRAVISTDFSSVSYEGFVFHPQLAWQHDNLYGTETKFKLCSGPIFASEGFMDYFFEVPVAYATPERRVYDADSGYLGMELRVSAVKRINSCVSVMGDIKTDFYRGSANSDSSLFRDNFGSSIRLGLMWTPFQSISVVSHD